MSARQVPVPPGSQRRAVRVVVRHVTIRSSSGLRARRLGDGLLPAIEAALGAEGIRGADAVSPPASRPHRSRDDAALAAAAIAAAVAARVRRVAP